MDATEFTVYELWTSGGQGVGSGIVMACELGEEDCVPPQFANCEPTGLGAGTSCGEVLKVVEKTARTSAPVWALAVSSPPSRAAASASPQAFLFSRVP